mmetsp:Transcript_3863/g.6266  ORF Transcript_3863/g.6266 Transcript_3863/m.6266 type:complete len:704 (+) Transcript_3863:2-2113(+)
MTENEPKKKAKVRKDKNGVRRKSDDPKQLTDAEQSDTTKTSTNTSTATTATTSSSNNSASSSNTTSTNNTPKKRGSNSEGKRRVKGSRISKPANKQTEQPPPIPPASAAVPPTPPEPDAATLSVIDVIVAQSQGTPPPVPPLDSSTSDNNSDDDDDSSDSDTSTTPAVPETPEARRQREIAFNAKRKQASKNERLKPNGSISDSPEIHAAANGDASESDEEDWSEECLVDVYVKRSDTKTSTKPILRAPQRFVVVEKPTTSPTVDSAAAAGRQRRVTFPASIVQRDRARVFEEKAKERLASFKLASRTELLKARLNNITEADVPDPTGPAPPLPPAKHQVPTTPALPADDDDDGPPPPLPPSDAAAPPSPAAVTSAHASPPAPATTAATAHESQPSPAATTTNDEKASAPAKAVEELSAAPPMPSTPPAPIGDAPAVPATPRDDGVDELPPTPVWPWRNAPADVTSLRDEFRKTIEVMAERFKLELADVQQSSNIVDKNDSAARTAKLIGVIAERDLTIAWLKRALSAVHGPRPPVAAAASSQSSSSSSGAKSDAANCPTCGTAFEAPPMPISSSPLAHKTKVAVVPSSSSASGALKGRTLPLGNIRRRQSSETDAATAAAASAAMLGGVISPRQHYAMRERRSRDMLRLLADEAEDQERVGSEAALARLNKQSLDAKDKFEQQHRDYIEFINQKKKQLSNRK